MTDKTRRQFLKASVSTAGGLMVGFSMPSSAKENPYQSLSVSDDVNEINAWLVIEPSGEIIIRVAQSEMGQGVLTSMPMIIADELEADWRKVRPVFADANRHVRENQVYKRMLTGGSGAVRRSRVYLQQAGAEARERLIKAGAERWHVPLNECYADYGQVIHRSSKRTFSYGELAADAVQVSVTNVKIKTPEQFSLMGLAVNRVDVPAKVNGTAQFGMDVRLDGMVYAAVIHCPVLGGKLRSYRFNGIRNLPGVIQAVRLERGVAVVAKTYWQAKKAAEKLSVDWEFGAALDNDSADFRNEFQGALDGTGKSLVSEGDGIKALETAAKTLQSDYHLPYLAHACMEPLNCTVHIQSDKVEVWAGVQNPESALYAAAEASGYKPEDVYMHNCFLGGGFGPRSHTDYITEAVQIAKAVDLPLQMIWSREQDMRGGRYRPMAAMRFKAGLDFDNNISAYTNHSVTHSILKDAGRMPASGIDGSSVEGLENMPYSFAQKTISHTQKNTSVSSWWWRSVGSSQNAFAMECFIDELAEASKMDAFDFRVKYLQHRPDLLKVLSELKRKSDWLGPMPAGTARGLALHESFGTIVGQVAEVSLNLDGKLKVRRFVSVIDCGNLVNPRTADMQIESGIIYGLTAALYGRVTIEQGRVLEGNFDTYRMLNMADTPKIETHWLLSGGDKWGGLGEPGLPCVAPALANAIHKLTGRRIRSLPITDYVLRLA